MERDRENFCSFATLTPGSTKEPISALPKFGSTEKFGSGADLRNMLQELIERYEMWFQLSI